MSEQLRVELTVQQSRYPERGPGKVGRDELMERMQATVELWNVEAQRAQKEEQSSVEVQQIQIEPENAGGTDASVVRRLRSGVMDSLETVRRVAAYTYSHPGEVGKKVTQEVGWVGVGMAVKGAVVATGSAMGAAALSMAAVGSAIAAGSVNAIRDNLLLNKEADARELKIAREAKKLKNARELYRKYTHVDAKKDAQNTNGNEMGWLGKAYRAVMVDGVTRRGVELAYDVQKMRDEMGVIKGCLAQHEVVARMSEQELLGMMETTSELIYRAQSVEERKEAQKIVKELYGVLQEKAIVQGKDVSMYREVIAEMMKERQQRFESDSRKAVMMAGVGKGVDALWKFASGAVFVDAGRGIGNFWNNLNAGESVAQANSIAADVTRGVYEAPQAQGGSTKVWAKMAPLVDQNVQLRGNTVNFAEVEMQADSYVRTEVIAPAVSIQVEPGQGLFAAMRDSGMSVTEEGSARIFLERIAPLAVFNLSQEKIKLLLEIVSKNPNISADQLRTLARAQGIDFDRDFGVRAGVIEVPAVERAVSVNVEPLDAGLRMEQTQGGGKALFKLDDHTVSFQQFQPPKPPIPPEPNLYVIKVNPTRVVGADSQSPASVSHTTPVEVVQSGVVHNNEGSPYVVRAAAVRIVGADKVVPSTAVATVRTEVVQPANANALAVTRAPRVVGYEAETTAGTRPAESVVVAPSVPESVTVPVVSEPMAVETPTQHFLWNGFDVSPENAVNLRFGNATVMMDGKAYNLFNFLPEWTRQRVYNQDFSVEMSGFFDGDTYAYDPVKRNIFIFVHSWRTDGKELPAEWLRRMIEGGYDIPPYSQAQIDARMQEIVNQNIVVPGTMFGRSMPMRLTEIQRISHAETMSLSMQELFDYVGVEEGKAYLVFCSGSHPDALNMFARADVQALSGFPRDAFNVLMNPNARGDEYVGALQRLAGWLQSANVDKYNEFFRLFDRKAGGTEFSAENMGYARYIVELSPAGQ